MSFWKKETKVPVDTAPVVDDTGVGSAADVEAVMKKYDRESNTRVWEGIPKIIVNCVLVSFSLFCLYVIFFANMMDECRLTSFMAYNILIGYLVFPVKKGKQKVNAMPWYDYILMILGAGSFLYYTFCAKSIVQQGSILEGYQIVIGVIGVLTLAEL